MKKLLFIVGLLLIPITINAENRIYFDEKEINIEPGGTYDVNIKVDSDNDFTEIDFDVITTLQQLKIDKIEISDKFTNKNTNGYSLKATTPQKSGTVVAKVTLKADYKATLNSSGLIKIIDSELISDTKYSLDKDEISVNITKSLKSNYLKSLSSEIVSFEFDKEKTEYEFEVDSSVKELDLVAIPEDESATVDISSQKLNKEKNEITIKVSRDTLEDRVYKVTVIKKVDKDLSKMISKDTNSDKKKLLRVKKKWIPIIFSLLSIFIVNIFFLKKCK